MAAILECSSKGDKRFSALYAKVEVFGKLTSIEEHYQLAKRFPYAPKTWRQAKGRKPVYFCVGGKEFDIKYLTCYYKFLWLKYLDAYPELVEYARQFDDFHDSFAKSGTNSQADVIRQYVKRGRQSILDECREFIELLGKER